MKFKIGRLDNVYRDLPVHLYLRESSLGGVDLMAHKVGCGDDGEGYFILSICETGHIFRPGCVSKNLGLPLDSEGKIVID